MKTAIIPQRPATCRIRRIPTGAFRQRTAYWFGGGKPDDSLGALPYDTYLLEEQPCEANKGKDLVSLEVTVSRDDFAVDLGSIDNYTVELHTSAADTATGTKTVAPSGEASVTDTVTYRESDSRKDIYDVRQADGKRDG